MYVLEASGPGLRRGLVPLNIVFIAASSFLEF